MDDKKENPSASPDQQNQPEVNLDISTTHAAIEEQLSVTARKEKKLKELSDRREAKELSPHDFDLNFIFQLNEAGLPLTRKDMAHKTGNQALVLTREDFDILGCLDFIHVSGERMVIEAECLDPDDIFILYPHEVGDEEKPR